MAHLNDSDLLQTRRQFFASGRNVLGSCRPGIAAGRSIGRAHPGHQIRSGRTSRRKAKRVIYLHMVGGPSQMDLFDYKPVMQEWYDKDLPESIRMGQRLTTMTSGQARFPVAPSEVSSSARPASAACG